MEDQQQNQEPETFITNEQPKKEEELRDLEEERVR